MVPVIASRGVPADAAPTLAGTRLWPFPLPLFRLYKRPWQKIRIVCYRNASLQCLERALF